MAYDNGKTYVRDPFNANNNGWYSLDYIHGVQSRDAMDTKLLHHSSQSLLNLLTKGL